MHGDLTCDAGMDAIVERVLAAAPDRFALAGLSMGGIAAMHVVGRAPGRVTRLALLDTNHLADAPERRPVRERQIEAVRQGGLREVIVDEMKPQYLAEGHAGDRALLDALIAMALDLGPDVFVRQSLALLERGDATPALQRWSGEGRPTLVMCGAEDRLCPPERHRAIHALVPHATLSVLPGTGHIATLEAPEAVSAAMAAWLGEV